MKILVISGWILAIIWGLLGVFLVAFSKDEKKQKDGIWKAFLIGSIVLFVTAAYCAISACMINMHG